MCHLPTPAQARFSLAITVLNPSVFNVVKRRLLQALFAFAGGLSVAGHACAAEIAAPYVPTAPSVVDRMLQIAKVGPADYLIDLGSGDGRIVITAAKKYGASGFGVDIDAELVKRANATAVAEGVGDRVRFYERDLFATDLSRATVIAIYLMSRATLKLQSSLFSLNPGVRIVSHAGSMGAWRPDHFEMLDVKDRVRADAPPRTYIHFWIVPAKIAGAWRWSMPINNRNRDYELSISQTFQNFSGTLRLDGVESKIEGGRLAGESIVLNFAAEIDGNFVQHRFAGQVSGQSILGTATVTHGGAHADTKWEARRVANPEAAAAPNTGPIPGR